MHPKRLSATLWIVGCFLLTTPFTAFAGTELFDSATDLRVSGFTSTGVGPTPSHRTASALPYIDQQTITGDGFVSTSSYLFTNADFHIDFSRLNGDVMARTSGLVGNQAETAGNIFFTITEDTPYVLTGDLGVFSANSGIAEIFGAISVVEGQTANELFQTSNSNGSISTGALVLPTRSGILLADHPDSFGRTTYEFRFSAFIEASTSGTSAAATGFLNLHLGPPVEQPPETPLPTVATAGLALFGVLSFSRTRRQPAR